MLAAGEDVGVCMSLVGNLEDLSLGDLLQIVSLSQKSGLLSLESTFGAGRIVFRSGLVHAAAVKGQTRDLRGLLAEAGLLEGSRYDAIVAAIGPRHADLPLRIAAEAGLDAEKIDALIRRSAEAAIFTMFAWATGEFSFDALRDGGDPETHASLQRGLNAQYLAMEGMRLRDEATRSKPGEAADPEIELSDEVFFGSDALETDADTELDFAADAQSSTGSSSVAPPTDAFIAADASRTMREALVDVLAARAAEPVEEAVPAPSAARPGSPAALDADAFARPVVVVEPDAVALEWLKSGIEGDFARVHVFQRAEQGLARIRQYLIRGDVPIVLIALTTPIDPLSGIHGLPDFVRRLRTQAPRIVVVGLRESGEAKAGTVPGYLDGVITRPARQQLRGAALDDDAARPADLAHSLVEIVTRKSRGNAVDAEGAAADSNGAMTSSPGEAAEQTLASARSQNDVFTGLLDAAAALYARGDPPAPGRGGLRSCRARDRGACRRPAGDVSPSLLSRSGDRAAPPGRSGSAPDLRKRALRRGPDGRRTLRLDHAEDRLPRPDPDPGRRPRNPLRGPGFDTPIGAGSCLARAMDRIGGGGVGTHRSASRRG